MRIALLRGINVGGHNVTKDVLCEVLMSLGLTGVRTFIASGNLLFDDDDGLQVPPGTGPDPAGFDADLEVRIGWALEERLGWSVPTFVRSPVQVGAVASHPLAAELAPAEGETLQIGFWHRALDEDAAGRIDALSTPTDVLRVAGRELYWLCRGSVGRSKVTGARLERAGGAPVTCRSITTIHRLVDLTRPQLH